MVAGLYEQIGRLQTELNWLKKSVVLTIEQRRHLISPDDPDLSLQRQCELLGLSRSSYYYQKTPLSKEDERLMQLLDRHYTDFPSEGKVKRSLWLSHEVGYVVGRKRVNCRAFIIRHGTFIDSFKPTYLSPVPDGHPTSTRNVWWFRWKNAPVVWQWYTSIPLASLTCWQSDGRTSMPASISSISSSIPLYKTRKPF